MAVASKFSVAVLSAIATAWQKSSSVDEVVNSTNITKDQVMEAVTYLRQKGYALKNMRASAELSKEQIEAFTKAWNESSTISAVAEKLGITNAEVAKQKRQVVKSGAVLNVMKVRLSGKELEEALAGIVSRITEATEPVVEPVVEPVTEVATTKKTSRKGK